MNRAIPAPPRTPLKFQAYQKIKAMLTDRQIASDRPITEMELSRTLGMGRTPIREALNLLSKDGLVELFPHKGAVLKTVSHENLIHLYQIREVLDPLAASQAFGRIDLNLLGEIEKKYLDGRSGDWKAGEDFSWDLHALIYRSCLNPYLSEVFASLQTRMQVCLHSLWELWARAKDRQFMEKRNREHLAIIQALRQRDGEAVARVSREHISRAIRDIFALMAVDGPPVRQTAGSKGKGGGSASPLPRRAPPRHK
jgi:DNA-binding GntR family transcriptional regulator